MHSKPGTIIGIGASTGGPKALKQVLTDLPEEFAPPIIIVQHMPEGFTESLARRLDHAAGIHVKEARNGEVIERHTAYIAPGNFHIKLNDTGTDYTVELTQEKQRHGQRPSVDVLFESLTHLQDVRKVAVILTGMGTDGSEGIRLMKKYNKNAEVISESKKTSVVYGMPKAAVETNHVDYCADIDQIGKLLKDL